MLKRIVSEFNNCGGSLIMPRNSSERKIKNAFRNTLRQMDMPPLLMKSLESTNCQCSSPSTCSYEEENDCSTRNSQNFSSDNDIIIVVATAIS